MNGTQELTDGIDDQELGHEEHGKYGEKPGTKKTDTMMAPGEDPVGARTINIGGRAMKVVVVLDEGQEVKPHILEKAAAASLAKEIITGIDPNGRKYDKTKFDALEGEGKAKVAAELIRALGVEDFRTNFDAYFDKFSGEIAEAMLDAGLAGVVARYLQYFAKTKTERENIALMLIQKKVGHYVVANRKQFGVLDKGIEKLLEDYM